MIAPLIPDSYDLEGHAVARPKTPKHFPSALPMAAYVTQPITVHCKDLDEIRTFLNSCSYVSDQEQYGLRDYWMPPEAFERSRKGDCEDFALWTWRQLIDMGYEVRYVVGRAGSFGYGHAWLQFRQGDSWFALEPLARRVSTLPRLMTIYYQPAFSAEWIDGRIQHYEHQDKAFKPPVDVVVRLLGEYIAFWVTAGLRLGPRMIIRDARDSGTAIKTAAQAAPVRIRRVAAKLRRLRKHFRSRRLGVEPNEF